MFDGNKIKLHKFVINLHLIMIGNVDQYLTTQKKLVFAANELKKTAMD